jgi:hypothetical protein
MKFSSTVLRNISIVFWVLAVAAVAIWSAVPGYVVGWDLRVYGAAVEALRAGHDPYADGVAIQRVFHSTLAQHPTAPPPFTYVYSPLTLLLLRLLSSVPLTLTSSVYWIVYAAAVIASIWIGLQFVEEKERIVFGLLAPAAVFFPGLLQNDVLFSGNIAYILYGLMLSGAWIGWRRGDWKWFYLATLAASCCKAPLLSMLAIPVLSARRQWIPAAATGAVGVALFAMQPMIWPTLFQHYLEAVELQFSFNHDFSSSPAGLLADALYDVIPYSITSSVFYLFYAAGFFVILLLLSRRFLAGRFSLKQFAPVLLVGTLLLNPRIMEYDVAPITLPMALIMWRFIQRGNTLVRAGFLWVVIFGALNGASRGPWRPTECLILVGLFGAGAWDLFTLNEAAMPEHGLAQEAARMEVGAR